MKHLKEMKKMLIDCVYCQMSHLEDVNTKELGEAIDMIKDLSETIYYCTIVEAMGSEEKGEEHHDAHHASNTANHGDGPTHHGAGETNSAMTRKHYMESKELHKDKTVILQELEKYAQELTSEMVEMIEDATPEEKQYLSNRLAVLATKIK